MSHREVLLSKAELPLTMALKRLVASEPRRRAFVIVEEEAGERFVQFAGVCPASEGEPLVFDVPALSLQEPYSDPEVAAERAIVVLKQLGLCDEAVVRIIESATWDDGTKEPVPGRTPVPSVA